MVEKVFKDMTSEGGKFYQMQEVQAETLKGKLANLTDAYQIMFSEIGDKHSSALKGAVDLLRALAQNYERIGRLLGELIVAYGTYRAALAATAVSDAIIKYGSLAKAIESTALAQRILNSTMLQNPLALLVGLFGALAMSMTHTYDAAHKLSRELSNIADTKFLNARDDADNLERLANNLKNCTKGSQDYRDAINAINNQYGDYLPHILTEKQSYEQLKGAIDQATAALYAKARANAYEAGSRRIEEQYGEVIAAYRQTFIDKLINRGETQDSAKALVALYFEAIKDAAEGYDPSEIFNEVYKNFKDTGDDFFSGRENFWNNLKQGLPFIRNIYGVNDSGWQTARDALWNMTSATDAYNAALSNLSDTIEARFSGIGTLGFTNEAEMLDVKRISSYFDEEEKKIRANASLSREAVEGELNKLNIRKLEMLAKYYEELSRPDKAQQFREQADALQHVVTGWRAIANGFVDQTNSGLLANNYDYLEYVDMLRSEYKNVEKNAHDAAATAEKMQQDFDDGVKGITKADVDRQRLFAEALANRKKIIENIGNALNVSIDDKVRKATTVGNSGDVGASVKKIEEEIAAYRELKRTYDNFRQYTSKENADRIMAQLFPGFASNAKYDEIIQALLASLKTLGTEGQAAAAKIEGALRGEKVKEMLKEYEDAAKKEAAFQERITGYYQDARTVQQKMADLKKQMADDLAAVSGDQIKSAAIIAHYTGEFEKLEDELRNLTQISLTDFWQQLTGDKEGYSYKSLRRLRKEAMQLQEVLKGIAPNRDSEGKITGYTLNRGNAGIFADVFGLTDDNKEITITVAQLVQLSKIVNELFNEPSKKSGLRNLFDMIKDKGIKAFVEDIKNGRDALKATGGAAKEIGQIGGILKEIGEAAGSDTLQSLGETFSFLGDFVGNLASGDYIGAIASVASAVASWVEAERQLREAIRETALEAERQNVTAKLSEGVATIFGDNTRQAIENAKKILDEYKKLAQTDISKYANGNISWKRGLFNWGTGTTSLKNAVAELGYQLYDAYGNLNAKALQAILDTYENLTSADKTWIEDAIKNSELYTQAMEQLDSELENIYGQMLDNVADALVESWKSAGNAALDYADILDDVATSYAKMILKQALIDKVFTPEIKERIKTLSSNGDYEAALQLTEQKLQEIAGMQGVWNDILSQLGQYMQGSESSDTLASGIKSITEDTANLLAAYVNAIRADVAYNRLQFETLTSDVKLMLGLLPNAPTLAEYLTQIQANTYNTAENTGAVLAELRSMMTSETGATSLRVTM